MFTLALTYFGVYILLVNIHLSYILIKNEANKPMIIANRLFVSYLCSLDPEF